MAKIRKTREYDRRALDKVQDIDYWNQLDAKDAEWLKQFLREEYSNDHSKPNSLYRQAYGDDYENKKIYTNPKGEKVALKQAKFNDYNLMMRDILNVARSSNPDVQHQDPDRNIQLDCFDVEQREIFTNQEIFKMYKEDSDSINSLLKHYSYQEVLDLLIEDFKDKYDYCQKDILVQNFATKIMLLAYKARYLHQKSITEKNKKKKANQ